MRMTMLPAAKGLLLRLVSPLFTRNRGCYGIGQLFDFDMLALHYFDAAQPVRFVSAGSGGITYAAGPSSDGFSTARLLLSVVVLEEVMRVLREVRKRGEQSAFLVVVVVALRPVHYGQRWILAVPGARVVFGAEDTLLGVGAAVAEGFIEPADAVVHAGQEHQVSGTPCVEVSVREDSRHAEALHLGNIVPTQFRPLIGEQSGSTQAL